MIKLYFVLLVCLKYGSEAVNIPSPLVYVVTPSSRNHQDNEARSAPFYYHNWMRRMDSPQTANTTTTTTTTPKVKTPDLIFAEFESDNGDNMRKSIRKLLEQERVAAMKTTSSTTTSKPIYIPEASDIVVNHDMGNVAAGTETDKRDEDKKSEVDMTDYFALYNNLYGGVNNNYIPKDELAPVYLPSTSTTSTTSTTTTTTTTTPAPNNVENIWHIIDSEKHNQYSGRWEEVPLDSHSEKDETTDEDVDDSNKTADNSEQLGEINENFALPGFATNPGNGAENESRAIRTEPNIRFPYVSLKPFVMKNMNKPLLSNSKKGNNMFTSLDSFKEIHHPVRGEIHDTVPMREPIDRYNPAQPYLPQDYGSHSKQSSVPSAPSKAISNLVPPPPPPPPKVTGDDFPVPTNYESFPPYPPSFQSPIQPQPPPELTPKLKPPTDTANDFPPDLPLDNDSDMPPMDLGYRYKPPSPPAFVPTLPPLSNSIYSYKKPADAPPAMDMGGYSYNKPAMTLDSPPTMDMGGYSYNKPAVTFDSPPTVGGYTYNKPQKESPPMSADKPDDTQDDHPAPSDDHHDNNYPELIYEKPPDAMNGFPSDIPGDLKFHHDFDDHDFDHYHHHHHHHTTTTTTTTEMPRVNRFSYYYLGKKLYYLPLYFSVYFIVYVGALIIKAVLRHKIVYPNSWRPNDTTAGFFSKRSVESWNLSNENLHEVTGRVTRAIAKAAEKYMNESTKTK